MATNGSDSVPGGNGPPPTPAGYGIDGHTMLATIVSFLFVVLLVLLFHVFARYLAAHEALGGRERAAASGADTTAVLVRLPRLDAAAIAGLPAFVYDGRGCEVAAECAVCLGVMEEGERARTLPNCGHVFHLGCIDTWLGVHSTCPLCRRNADPGDKEAVKSTPTSPPPAPPQPAGHGVEEGIRESESD
ncbi:RING-H2 finger protein ATL40-like [Curcuma longa]|uniref:RING-H2 finger protein ATL40-like n=1 Tax=Curcuma longa TaxID=136217 RepID=UPI003D9E1C0F